MGISKFRQYLCLYREIPRHKIKFIGNLFIGFNCFVNGCESLLQLPALQVCLGQ
jgi:hypothetical protein